MESNKEIFNKLADSLVRSGGNAEEITFWRAIFDDLTAEEQEKLIDNLSREAEIS